jgi:hypothetical protein
MTADELQTQLAARLDVPALANRAIVVCRSAMERVCQVAMEELGLLDDEKHPIYLKDEGWLANHQRDMEVFRAGAARAVKRANKAYREALPPLRGAENIRDFIACVAHGMAIEVFDTREASKMLYAAQVAASAEGRHSKSDSF